MPPFSFHKFRYKINAAIKTEYPSIRQKMCSMHSYGNDSSSTFTNAGIAISFPISEYPRIAAVLLHKFAGYDFAPARIQVDNKIKHVSARVESTRYTICPSIQILRLIRSKNSGTSFPRFGMSANSNSSSSDINSTELASPNVQINGSASCSSVLCSAANVTALSDKRKHRINARQKARKTLGFFLHP